MVETGFLKPKQVSRRADLTVVLLEELDELEYAAGLVDIDLGAVA